MNINSYSNEPNNIKIKNVAFLYEQKTDSATSRTTLYTHLLQFIYIYYIYMCTI